MLNNQLEFCLPLPYHRCRRLPTYRILHREELAPTVYFFEIEAPAVAQKAQPGQFVMVMVDEKGERIPLTIADWDRERGSISLAFSKVGTTTEKLSHLQENDSIAHFVGPLGKPAHIANFGKVACIAMGYGIVTMVPIARALREAGNTVFSLTLAPSDSGLIGGERLARVSTTLVTTTGEGAYGQESWFIGAVRKLLQGNGKIERVFAIGSLCMMRLVAATTRSLGIKTVVSLNPVMVDGTGMCGACRVSIGGQTRFACVDGPEFDGHDVDWELLLTRRCTYPRPQDSALAAFRCQHCAQW